MAFCKLFTNGLQYMNHTTTVRVAPCCYHQSTFLTPDNTLTDRLADLRTVWPETPPEELPEMCKVCITQEESGLPSLRNHVNKTLDGTTDKLEFLSIVPGMHCNMACAICSPRFSSYWYQEEVRRGNANRLDSELIELHNVTDPEFTEFYNTIYKQDLTELKYLRFGGGEPLMMPQHTQLLRYIPHPENVTLHYASNFSIMPTQEILDLWSKFKLVKWVASVDGVEEQFEYIRWPYKWNTFQTFVKKAIATVPSNVMFGVEHTINCFNAFYLDRFEEWFNNEFATNREGDPTDFNKHLCGNEFGFSLIPPRLREAIVDKYGPGHYLTHLIKSSPQDTDYTESVKLWDKLYRDRGLDWKKVFPEIVPYYEEVL